MSDLELKEVKSCIDGAISATALIQEETTIIVAVTLSDLLKRDLPPRENILDPWLPKSGLCMVYAKRGIGKTFFALEIAMAVAYGAKFLSFNASKSAKVLYIDGEMPANTMQERLAGIEQRMLPNHEMHELVIITPDFQDGFMPDLSSIEGQESIFSYTEEADLIIVDNISTLGMTGKENEAESWLPMQQWALTLRKQGKSVLFIHHAGKNGSQRGTSKREDVLDTVITLKQPSDYEPSGGACFELHYEKARGMVGDCVNPMLCQLTENGWEYKSLEQDNYQKVVAMTNDDMQQKDIADELGLSKGQVSKLIKKARGLGEVKQRG
jgi:putative DNA primase/helicase